MKRQIAGLTGFAAVIAAAAAYAAYEDSAPEPSADVRIEMSSAIGGGVGSGVAIAPGFALTNAHVACDGAATIKVVDRKGAAYDAVVLWCNKEYDLAALQFSDTAGRVGVATLDCRVPEVGDTIRSVGNPAGLKFVTMNGRVAGSPQALPPKWESVMLVDMTMIAGMSGGAAYGSDGQVVGINAGVLPAGIAEGLPVQGGLSMVIPASIACMLTGRG